MLHKKNFLIKMATWASIIVASILVVVKSVAWQYSHALSVQASLVDSFLDGLASVINFFAVRHALRPADEDHRFGHGKAEALAGLGQSGFIAASAIWLIVEGIHRFFDTEKPHESYLAMYVMGFSIVATFGLVIFQTYVVNRTKSLAISADSLHYKADLMTNISVLISLILMQSYGILGIDILVGLGIAVYILFSSWQVGRDAVNVLMDRELDDHEREEIIQLVLNHPDVLSIHELRTRSSGFHMFIQMHLDLPEALSFRRAHDVSKEVSDILIKRYLHVDVIIHIDPLA